MAKRELQDFKKVTEIAGAIALLIYLEQRQDPNNMDFKYFRFRYDQSQWKDVPKYNDFQKNLLSAADNNLADLQNAIMYLSDENVVTCKVEVSSADREYRDFHLTSRGFQIIENVDNRDPEARKQFNIIFNFQVESLLKIDSLLKNDFKMSLFGT